MSGMQPIQHVGDWDSIHRKNRLNRSGITKALGRTPMCTVRILAKRTSPPVNLPLCREAETRSPRTRRETHYTATRLLLSNSTIPSWRETVRG